MNERELDMVLGAMGNDRMQIPDPPELHERVLVIPATTPQKRGFLPPINTRRFQSMFSATKFVVAGVIVALFGGFLLTGVLTQRSDEPLPVVGASASSESDATIEATSENATTPQRSITTDLLPGVDLVTREVGPGVFRVLNDGERDLRENVWDVAIDAEGNVLVVQNAFGFEQTGDRDRIMKGGPRVRHLGRAGTPDPDGLLDDDGVLGRPGPGVIEVSGRRGARDITLVFDGSVFVESDRERLCPRQQSDGGACWRSNPAGPGFMRRGGANGTAEFLPAEMGLTGQSGIAFDVDDEGSVVAAMGRVGRDDFQASLFDGESWTRITPGAEPPAEGSQGNPRQNSVAFGPDGTVWAATWDRADDLLWATRWDGTAWTTLAPAVTKTGLHWRPRKGFSDPEPRIYFNPDGPVWFDGLTLLVGDELRSVPVPENSAREPFIAHAAHAPNGALWLLIHDDDGCPDRVKKARGKTGCPTVPEGLYVITPETLAATE